MLGGLYNVALRDLRGRLAGLRSGIASFGRRMLELLQRSGSADEWRGAVRAEQDLPSQGLLTKKD